MDTFLHGIDLSNWYPCWNLYFCGRLWSSDATARVDEGIGAVHQSLGEASLADIEKGKVIGVPTPRYIYALSIPERRAVELAFEKIRRDISPQAPDRLSSLYLAEDSPIGETHIRKMLAPYGSSLVVIRMRVIEQKAIFRADTAWYDLYVERRDVQVIRNYWRGEPATPDGNTWEYLLDGGLQAVDLGSLRNEIRAKGELPPGCAGWPSLPVDSRGSV